MTDEALQAVGGTVAGKALRDLGFSKLNAPAGDAMGRIQYRENGKMVCQTV